MKKMGIHFLAALTAVGLLFANTPVLAKNNTSTKEQAGKIKGVQTVKKNTSKSTAATQEIPDYYSMVDNPTIACYFFNPTTLNEIENLSDTIVRATFLGVEKQEQHYDSWGNPSYGFTRSKIRVDEVFTGNVGSGDVLEIIEPYEIRKDQDSYILTHGENYYPSEIGKSYIWILDTHPGSEYDPSFGFSNDQLYYSLLYCERGRYPFISSTNAVSADIKSMTNRELNLSPQGNASRFKSIYAEVAEKYMGIPNDTQEK